MGCSFSPRASPSMVSSSPPSACAASIQQELMERSLRITPQPQQSPVPQISFVHHKWLACSASSSVSPGSTSHLTLRPFTFNEITSSGMMPLLLMRCQSCRLSQCARGRYAAHTSSILRRSPVIADGPNFILHNFRYSLERFLCSRLADQCRFSLFRP